MADTKKTWPRTLHTLEKPGTPDTALKKRKAYLPLHQTQQQKHCTKTHLTWNKNNIAHSVQSRKRTSPAALCAYFECCNISSLRVVSCKSEEPLLQTMGKWKSYILGYARRSESMKKLISGLNPHASVSLATWNRGYKKFNSWWAAGWFLLKASPLFSIWRGSKKWKSPCSSWPLHIWVLSRALC